MRVAVDIPIGELVPHGGRMCLLDRAIEADEASLLAELTICADDLFHDGHGVGAWVGVEYMAQCVAAWAGWQAQQRGERPRIGVLLGTRQYLSTRSLFRTGEVLRIETRCEFRADNGTGKFDGRITIAEEVVATATLMVYEPSDAGAYLTGQSA